MPKIPIFSIIVPTHNRPYQLAICLEAIVNQTYPSSNFEVIVIDDGSKSPIAPAVSRFHDRLNLTLITQPNRGPALARNTGAAKAQGRYLAFTDDDCAPAPDWLQKLEERFDSISDIMVGGKTINVLTGNAYSTASQVLISYLYEYYNADKNNARFLTSNNIAVSTKSFRALGGFDPGYPSAAAEDRDFCDKWQCRGHHMIYAPEVIVYHRHNLSLRSFLMQHFAYGRGASRFHQTRSIRSDRSLRLEPLSFYINLMLYPFGEGKSRRSLFIAALLFLSQMSNAAGFFWGLTTRKCFEGE
jgi:glycosyltransferase involved in cell wall biosynthesis